VQLLGTPSADVAAARRAPDDAMHAASLTIRDALIRALPPDRAARFVELGGAHASDWLLVTPCAADGTLITRPAVAAACLALYCGVPALPADILRCPGAGHGCARAASDPAMHSLDRHGIHAANCSTVFTKRHNAARDTMIRAWREGFTLVAELRKEVGVDAAGDPVVGSCSPSRPGDLAYRAHPQAQWTYVDYTAGAPPPRHVLDPYAAALGARTRKMTDPRQRTLASNPNASRAIVAQGTMGGLDPQSFKVLEGLAGAAGIERDDHHARPWCLLRACSRLSVSNRARSGCRRRQLVHGATLPPRSAHCPAHLTLPRRSNIDLFSCVTVARPRRRRGQPKVARPMPSLRP
jgi:hypothetical protein